MELEISVGKWEASTLVDSGIDASVVVTLDGARIDGCVTLVRDGQDRWAIWGDGPDGWLSSEILDTLRDRDDCDEIIRAIGREVESSANG